LGQRSAARYSIEASSLLKRRSSSSTVLGKPSSLPPNTISWGRWRQVNTEISINAMFRRPCGFPTHSPTHSYCRLARLPRTLASGGEMVFVKCLRARRRVATAPRADRDATIARLLWYNETSAAADARRLTASDRCGSNRFGPMRWRRSRPQSWRRRNAAVERTNCGNR
jgi:hypothetical protein